MSRLLDILRLFRDQEAPWTVEALARETGASVSSVYRDVQGLLEAGFIGGVRGAGYVLGPAFIEYDRLVRRRDPLISLAAAPMRGVLADATPSAVVILCRRYRNSVMCVHQERGEAASMVVGYERGVSMPLFAGASSKAILAHLDDRALKRLYLENEAAISARPGTATWEEFRAVLRAIRKAGIAVTRSEVTAGLVGMAAPIRLDRQVIASMSLILTEADAAGSQADRMGATILAAADGLSARLADAGPWVSR